MKDIIVYDKKCQAIRVNGEKMIDLSAVTSGSRAILYPKTCSEQDYAFETTFNFSENECFPFLLDEFSFTPASLVRTLVENELMISGLEYSGELAKAYRTL